MYTRTKKTLTYSVLERPVCIRRPAASTDVNASANVTMVVFIVLLCCFFLCFFLVFFFCLHFGFLIPPFWNKYLSIPLGMYLCKTRSKRPEIYQKNQGKKIEPFFAFNFIFCFLLFGIST